MSDKQHQPGGEVLEKTRTTTDHPKQYKVILHNDDYTTMDFVVEVLETVFNKHPAEAFRIMMHVHTQDRGICGVYPYEIAETKLGTVHDMAKTRGFPLRGSMEED